MLISKNWLGEFVKLSQDTTNVDIAKRLSNAVVEVEGITDQAASFNNMVVGKITSVTQHPNADRLKVCLVDVGGRTTNIVCGGSNVVEGMKVAVALIGARVRWHGQGDLIELQKTAIRGVESEGMICAGVEIGQGKPTDGEKEIMDLSSIAHPAGTPLAEVFGMNDVIFEIDHKALSNRPDLFGCYGIARELSALYSLPLTPYTPPPIQAGSAISINVRVKDKTLCPRYMAVAMEGVTVQPSPEWLVQRLQSCGIRSINTIVDVTNYVLLEIGQPMHVFDADKVGGSSVEILVRNAKKNESLLALDDKTYALDADRLVITDGKKPTAIAGVMGGKESAVSDTTTRIVFESANFNPASIRKTSQALGLRSESSLRFEKSLDPNLCEQALARAVELVTQLCPTARVASAVVDIKKPTKKPPVLKLSPEFVNLRLGSSLSGDDMKDILTRLGFGVTVKGKKMAVTIPSWRATKDIGIIEDLVEEIVRIHGYENIPSTLPEFPVLPPKIDRWRTLVRLTNEVLVTGFGATETFTYAFTSPDTLTKLGLKPEDHIKLANPLSDERPYLVQSHIPNLLEQVRKNQRDNQQVLLCVNERVFLNDYQGDATGEGTDLLPKQPRMFAVAYAEKGNATPFWKAKHIALSILERAGFTGELQKKTALVYEHPGRVASLVVQGTVVGTVAEIHPTHAKTFGLEQPTAVVELNLDLLATLPIPQKAYIAVPLYPSVTRDIAFVLNANVEYTTIQKALSNVSPLLVGTDLFDVYQGKGVEDGKKSMAIHLAFRAADHTLTSEEIDPVVKHIQAKLESEFHAVLRV